MRKLHFEAIRPVCPLCRTERHEDVPLVVGSVEKESGDAIEEGVLHCGDSACRMEYPIIDGIPLLLPALRSFVSNHLEHLIGREDLSAVLESLLGDAVGPGTSFDTTRQHLSIYGWDHYGDLDPEEARPDPPDQRRAASTPAPGSVVRCLDAGLDRIGRSVEGPVVDLGCAVGRAGFELARRFDGPVLGVDLNVSMLRLASRVLRDGVVRYPRRRVGIVHDRREFPVRFPGADRVDFWACDALALPFPPGTFGLVSGLNLVDCVASPPALLESIERVLRPGGAAILTTPYDWSAGATPVEAWLGGHSQRGPDAGAGVPVLRALLTPGAHPQSLKHLRLIDELDPVPWHTRLHERSTVSYEVHLVVAELRRS